MCVCACAWLSVDVAVGFFIMVIKNIKNCVAPCNGNNDSSSNNNNNCLFINKSSNSARNSA